LLGIISQDTEPTLPIEGHSFPIFARPWPSWGGLALIKFSSDPMFVAIGIVLIPGGIVVLVQGFALFRRMRMVILEEEKISDSEIE
jgi:hypothetical protein